MQGWTSDHLGPDTADHPDQQRGSAEFLAHSESGAAGRNQSRLLSPPPSSLSPKPLNAPPLKPKTLNPKPLDLQAETQVSTTETTITVNLELSETGTAWCQVPRASALSRLKSRSFMVTSLLLSPAGSPAWLQCRNPSWESCCFATFSLL